jgi:hypothetical protein
MHSTMTSEPKAEVVGTAYSVVVLNLGNGL